MLIKQALQNLIKEGRTKYSLAKALDCKIPTIYNYLNKENVQPNWKVCKNMYDKFGIVLWPYRERELKVNNEQGIFNLGEKED